MIQRAGILVVLLALFAAACGGGSASSSDPDPLRIGLTPTRDPGDVEARSQLFFGSNPAA